MNNLSNQSIIKPLVTFVIGAYLSSASQVTAQEIPLVYSAEHDDAFQSIVQSAGYHPMEEERTLRDPLLFADGKHRVKKFKQWSRRRAEIAGSIQRHEIGQKPAVGMDDIDARMSGDTLIVDVHVGEQTLTLSSVIFYPSGGEAPYPLMIGASNNSIPPQLFKSRNVAMMVYHERQVNGYSQFGKPAGRGHYPFDRLYPDLADNGAYSEWAWGFSRLIDGLQKLGQEVTKIDMSRIGVTGCSYAGKMALFCGALDERVALTIAQEPGGGGAASWRVSSTLGNVETLERADYNWFMNSMKENFSGEKLYLLPHDHHELISLCCPRAVLLLGNPDYEWLADPSMYVSSHVAMKVWEHFGIEDRIGYSIVPGHGHCQLPECQYEEVEAFLDKFLLGKREVNTKVRIAPEDYPAKHSPSEWIKW